MWDWCRDAISWLKENPYSVIDFVMVTIVVTWVVVKILN